MRARACAPRATSTSDRSLASVARDAERAIARAKRLIEKRQSMRAGIARARAGADDAQARALTRDVERVDESIDRAIARVEALREMAKALERAHAG